MMVGSYSPDLYADSMAEGVGGRVGGSNELALASIERLLYMSSAPLVRR
jgi:hypothetical protein